MIFKDGRTTPKYRRRKGEVTTRKGYDSTERKELGSTPELRRPKPTPENPKVITNTSVPRGSAQPFSRAEVEAARDVSKDIWNLSNDVLYKLCQNYPGNSDIREVITKVLIIGKTYSVPIERRPASSVPKIKGEDYYKQVATEITTLDLDAELSGMQSTEPSELKDLRPTLLMHQKLVNAVYKFSKNKQRSFASKYLHFHARNWFFILDSIATSALNEQVPRPRDGAALLSDIGDEYYRNFVTRAWRLREDLAQKYPPRLTLRQFDRLLYKRGLAH